MGLQNPNRGRIDGETKKRDAGEWICAADIMWMTIRQGRSSILCAVSSEESKLWLTYNSFPKCLGKFDIKITFVLKIHLLFLTL